MELVLVTNEADMFGYFIVQRARDLVLLVGVPKVAGRAS